MTLLLTGDVHLNPGPVADTQQIPAVSNQGNHTGAEGLPPIDSRTRRLRTSAVAKHHNFSFFQTVNHSKTIWDQCAKPKGLLGGHLNIRSAISKSEQLEKLLADSNLDFLCFSETWLTETSPIAAIKMLGYNYFRKDRKTGRGGGLLIM